MHTGIDVFLDERTIVRRGYDKPTSTLSFEDPRAATAGVNVYLGHVGYPDHPEVLLSQLRILSSIVGGMLTAAEAAALPESDPDEGVIAASAVRGRTVEAPEPGPDDPTDEPTDEPAVETCDSCGHRSDLHGACRHEPLGCVAARPNTRYGRCHCMAIIEPPNYRSCAICLSEDAIIEAPASEVAVPIENTSKLPEVRWAPLDWMQAHPMDEMERRALHGDT